MLLAKAATNEVAVKSTMPIKNQRLRPKRSPRPPVVIWSEAKTRV